MTAQLHPATFRATPLLVQTPDTVVAAGVLISRGRASYHSGHLESSRMAVLEDLGPVHLLPLSLLPSWLPPIPREVDLELAKEICSDGQRWKQWPKNPSDMSEHEDVVFKALPLLFTSIVESLKAEFRCKLFNNPSKAPSSMRSKPDGYLLRAPATFAMAKKELDESSTGDYWEDIAVPFAYKKKVKDKHDNERKIIWSIHHILRNDPSRRFTYGITIENTDLRVWLCNRAATYVSESFNFIQDQDMMIQVVAAMSLAHHSRLGWDPSLRRVLDVSGMFYDIDVFDDTGEIETFRADKIISDFGAETMQGRGTRVFRAKRTDGSIVVVKTGWQGQDRKQEGDILEDILSRMEDLADINHEADRKLFLTPIRHGYVHIEGELDHTLNLIMRGATPATDCPTVQIPLPDQLPTKKRSGTHRGSVGDTPHIGIQTHKRIYMGSKKTGISHRIQYRIVFRELAKSLHSLSNLKQMFQAITDATRALKIMHRCGYIHRDVSAGNILYFDGHGILADVEYAKRPLDESQHDVRTGTLHFISVEVQHEIYLFPSPEWDVYPVFKHNALHDLESLWWVAVWTLFTHTMEESSEGYDRDAHHETYSLFFPDSFGSAFRNSVLTTPEHFRIRAKVLPQEFKTAITCLHTAWSRISDLYRLAEKGAGVDTSVFDGAHDIIHQLLTKATDGCPGNVVSLDANDQPDSERPLKRTRRA